MSKIKRRRASCIVELLNEQGQSCFLFSHQEGDRFHMIPGGGIDLGETALNAGIRELKEETDLDTKSIVRLFDYESQHTIHHVFLLIPETQQFQAKDDVKSLWLFPISTVEEIENHPLLSNSTKHILGRYIPWRQQHEEVVKKLRNPGQL